MLVTGTSKAAKEGKVPGLRASRARTITRQQMERIRLVSLGLAVCLCALGTAAFAEASGFDTVFKMDAAPLNQVAGIVKDITVKGNVRQTTQGILATMRTKVGRPFSQAVLDQDRQTLFDLGVFKAQPNMIATQNPDGTYSISVEVAENPEIKEIRITGNTVFSTKQIMAASTIKVGDILSARAAAITATNIETMYSNKGYYARVVDLNYLPDSPQTLNLQILETTVSTITVTGNTRTKKRVLDRLIKTRPGEPFNGFKWQKDMQRMFNSGWFEKIDPKPDRTSNPGQVAWDVAVKEAKSGNFGLGVQVDPTSSFAGFIRYTDSNFKGTGQSVGAGFTEGTRGGGPSVDIDYGNPFIDNRDTSIRVTLYSRVVYRFTNSLFGGSSLPNLANQYIERRTGSIVGFTRPVSSDLTASITARAEQVNTSNISSTNGNGFLQQDGQVATLAFGLSRDRRDTTVDASRGYYLSGSIEPGYSNITEAGGLIANQSYLGSSGFVKFFAEYRGYFTRQPPRSIEALDDPRKVLALRLRAGTIVGPIPFFEQYFAGGTDTVRGYDEDRFWGKSTFLSTLEYRYPLQKAFSLIGFADYGGAWGGYGSVNSFTQSTIPKLFFGYGVGLAFKAGPLGTIRIDIGINPHGGTRTYFQIGPPF